MLSYSDDNFTATSGYNLTGDSNIALKKLQVTIGVNMLSKGNVGRNMHNVILAEMIHNFKNLDLLEIDLTKTGTTHARHFLHACNNSTKKAIFSRFPILSLSTAISNQ